MNGCRESEEEVSPTTLPGVGHYAWHVAEDRLVWSPELVRMYGLAEPPAAEQGFGRLLHPDDRVRVEAETLAFLEAGDTYQHEFRIVRPDGRVRVMHDRGAIERSPDGRALVLRGMNVDVTEQRLAHQTSGAAVDREASTDREAPFSLFLRQIPAAIAVFDRDMRYVAVSRQYREDYRLGHDARIAGRSLLDVFPNLPPARLDAHRRALAGPAVSDEAVTVRHGDGTSDVMRVRIAPWRTPDGRIGGVVLTSSVITGEVEARRRVEASEERLRFVTERAGIGLWHWDLASGRLEWWALTGRLFGLPSEASISYERFLQAVHPDDRGRVDAAVRACLDDGGGTDYDIEYRALWPDGTVRWIHAKGSATFAAGRPARMAGIAIDINERKLAVEDLRANEQRLQLAYEATGTGAWDADLSSGRSVWSPKLYDLLGLDSGLPASQELFFQHVHPDDLPGVRERYDAAVAAGGPFTAEFRVVRPDGAVRHVAGKGRVVAEAEGRPTRMIGVNYDITEHKRIEQRNAVLLRELGHRTKNILSLVQAVARQTARGNAADFLERFLERIRGLAAQQDLLVNNGWQEVMLHDLVRSQLVHFGDLIDRRIVISGPDVRVSDAAAQPLAMALHELATNASKNGALSNEAGRVEITWMLLGPEAGEQRFQIDWVERDGPPVVPPQRSGFGSTVIDGMARTALAASVEIRFAREGLQWRLGCAAERLRSQPDW